MKSIFSFLATVLFSLFSCYGQVQITHLLSEGLSDPIGLDAKTPGLSWQIASCERNVSQKAYEIRVTQANSKKEIFWNSGKVSSAQSVGVHYAGPELQSGEKYTWQVRVWDNHGKVSAWSAPAFWQMGLLNASDWKAQWISPGYPEDSLRRPSPLLRKTFTIGKPVRSATAYITAHGLYEAKINGARVGDALFSPGWTTYDKRLSYQGYDVTHLLQRGKNAIGITLGDGWYRGVFGQMNTSNNYGKDVSLLFQLAIIYIDGTSDTVLSDANWKSSTGPIRYADLYNGEICDARQEKKAGQAQDSMTQVGLKLACKIFKKIIWWPVFAHR